jgi:hypothetical protein
LSTLSFSFSLGKNPLALARLFIFQWILFFKVNPRCGRVVLSFDSLNDPLGWGGGKRVKIDVDYTRDESRPNPCRVLSAVISFLNGAAAAMISFQHFFCFLFSVFPFGSYYIDSLLRGIFVL